MLANRVMMGRWKEGADDVWNVSNLVASLASGWAGTGALITYTPPTLLITGRGSSGGPRAYYTTGEPCVEGDKIYVRAKIKPLNSDCQYSAIRIGGSTSGNNVQIVAVFAQNGVEATLSGIHTLTSASTGYIRVYAWLTYASAEITLDKEVELLEYGAVNLTAIWGAGNEPTKEDCDENLVFV